jgi:hypothetical protein
MQENVNVYNEGAFKSYFSQTDLLKTISKDYDYLLWEGVTNRSTQKGVTNRSTQIQHHLTPTTNARKYPRSFNVFLFYYLNFLLEKNPATMYDLGCGSNPFKPYIPYLIGIDPDLSQKNVDIIDQVDQTFIDSHQNHFESVFSVCALHFHPFTELRKVVDDFISMVKIGGRGFIALNVVRMFEREAIKKNINPIDHPFLKDLYIGIRVPKQEVIEEAENLTKKLLSGLNCDILVFDVDYSKGFVNAFAGNIRIVFERNE